MDFRLFVLVNAMLFIRPAELIPALLGLPIYEAVILACLAVSIPVVIDASKSGAMITQPINACVAGMLPAIMLSHMSNGRPSDAWAAGLEFAKLLLYYVLLVGVVNSAARLRWLLLSLAGFSSLITGLAVLHYHRIVNVVAIELVETPIAEVAGEEMTMLRRLGSTGLFQDPNDMSLLLVTSIVICLYLVLERRAWLWLAPLALFGHALVLTHSRGGFLALLIGVLAFLLTRYGRKAIPLGAVVLPALFLAFAGRQTDFTVKGSTGQARIELWDEGMSLFRAHPLFGIGSDLYDDEVGHVAHNSFIHAYTELGVLGGTLFLGMFYLAFLGLFRMGTPCYPVVDPELRRMHPYVLTILVCYTAGLMTLSCCYTIPTYTVIGLASVYLRLAGAPLPWPVLPTGRDLAQRLGTACVTFVVVTHVYLRVFGQFN